MGKKFKKVVKGIEDPHPQALAAVFTSCLLILVCLFMYDISWWLVLMGGLLPFTSAFIIALIRREVIYEEIKEVKR